MSIKCYFYSILDLKFGLRGDVETSARIYFPPGASVRATRNSSPGPVPIATVGEILSSDLPFQVDSTKVRQI